MARRSNGMVINNISYLRRHPYVWNVMDKIMYGTIVNIRRKDSILVRSILKHALLMLGWEYENNFVLLLTHKTANRIFC